MRASRRDLLRLVRAMPLVGLALPARAAAPKRIVTLLSDTHVAGTAYYDADRAVRALGVADALELRREPTNPHDARAIEIWTTGTAPLKLGYVPRVENEALGALIDDGALVRASVVGVDERKGRGGRGAWHEVRFKAQLVLG